VGPALAVLWLAPVEVYRGAGTGLLLPHHAPLEFATVATLSRVPAVAGGQSTGLSKIMLLAAVWLAVLFALLYTNASDQKNAACLATSQVRFSDR
jgi:hypothetical protein